MNEKIISWIDLILTTLKSWGDKIFEFFGLYTSKYSQWIVIGAIIFLASFVLQIRWRGPAGGRR